MELMDEANISNNYAKNKENYTKTCEESKSSLKIKKHKNPFLSKEEKDRRQKKRARVIIRNISFKVTEEQLRKHLEQWGTLEEVKLLKHSDGKLVGCAFVQYATINQATKAILKGNNQELLGRSMAIDWALGKDNYIAKKTDLESKKKKLDMKTEIFSTTVNMDKEKHQSELKENSENSDDQEEPEKGKEVTSDVPKIKSYNNNDSEDEQKSNDEKNFKINKAINQKHVSNDVKEGCTVFIKNVPFDAEDKDLRKLCRRYGPICYAIVNRERISGHSKGTAFVKFKTKESADLCLKADSEFILLDQILEPHRALSRNDVQTETAKSERGKDSRNLYLTREGLIMSGSKAAEGVSNSDMIKRHNLEKVKSQVLKNLNRFVSRNRLSIHNLPINYDNEKLKAMVIANTGFKPHECRVMRENKITAEHPKGKSKGFGFMSFNTHQEALNALRTLNNNPQIFGTQNRPIVAFSIEDRSVHKIKEKRNEKAKLNNPTFRESKKLRKQKTSFTSNKLLTSKSSLSDDKRNIQKLINNVKIKGLENSKNANNHKEDYDNFVGMTAKPGSNIRMRSNKKIYEQAQEHLKHIKSSKRKSKQNQIKQIHLKERKSIDRTKQKSKMERDSLNHLVNKYKKMIDDKANYKSIPTSKIGKLKRTKWYSE